MSATLRVLLIGATGRMGQALVRMAKERPNVRITGAVTHAGSVHLGRDVGELAGVGTAGCDRDRRCRRGARRVRLRHRLLAVPGHGLESCGLCRRRQAAAGGHHGPGRGTETGDRACGAPHRLADRGQHQSGCHAAIGTGASGRADAAAELRRGDHRGAPSAEKGCTLGHGAGAGPRGRAGARSGTERRVSARARRAYAAKGTSALRSMRAGDIVGDHTVVFAATGEQVVLSHRATDRNVFARGALDAAAWLAGRAPGHYFMRDIIL